MSEEAANRLCGSNVTIDWLVEKLKKAVPGADSQVDLKTWKAETIGCGQGFMSYIIRVHMTWDQQTPIPQNVVLKVPTVDTICDHMGQMTSETTLDKDEINKVMADFLLPMNHRNECTIYDMFRHNPPLPLPHTWYTQLMGKDQPGVIVMEDLSDRGALVNVSDGLRPTQLYAVAESLASLHAYSIMNQDTWEGHFPAQGAEVMKNFQEMIKGAFIQLSNIKPEYFEGKFDKIAHIFQAEELYRTVVHSSEEIGLPRVIVQGDMWTNNLIFEKQADGSPGDRLLAIIDWQLTHPGNLAEDFCRVLISSTRSEIRRHSTSRILEHYYSKLEDCMPEGEKVPFTLDQVHRAYERILPYGLFFYIFGLPLFISSPVVEGDNREERIEEMLLRGKCIVDEVIELLQSI